MEFVRQHLHLRIRLIGLLVAAGGFGIAYAANELTSGIGMVVVCGGVVVGVLGSLLVLGGPLHASEGNVTTAVGSLTSSSRVNVINALPRPEHASLIVGFWLVGLAGGAVCLVRGGFGAAALVVLAAALASGLVWAHAFGVILAGERRARRVASGLPARSNRDWIGLVALACAGFVAGFFGAVGAMTKLQFEAGEGLVRWALLVGVVAAGGILGAGYRWNWTPRGWDADPDR